VSVTQWIAGVGGGSQGWKGEDEKGLGKMKLEQEISVEVWSVEELMKVVSPLIWYG